MFLDKIDNNTIIVIKNSIRDNLIEKVRYNGLKNIKFLSMDELIYNFTFRYDERTIYYLIDKYDYDYDVCVKLIKNIYYVDDMVTYGESKLDELVLLKKELKDNNLLYDNILFKSNLCNYKIIIYNYGVLSKYYLKYIELFRKYTDVEIVNDNEGINKNNTIYEFDTLDEEVSYVAESISKLINDGMDINSIKICGINDEYRSPVSRIFKLYNLDIDVDDSRLYATRISRLFFEYLTSNINNTFDKLKEEIDLNNKNTLDIYNKIIDIVNKYAWCDDFVKIRTMLINDFKNTRINNYKWDKRIEVISSLDEASDDDYVFLISFNQGIIPHTFKDEDYLSDYYKSILGIDTSNKLNENNINKWLEDIKHTKNLIITYKKNSGLGEYYLSSLNDYLNFDIVSEKLVYSNYSNLYNKIELTKKIDNLIKYNNYDEGIDILFSNYPDISYLTYDNKFTGVDNELLTKYFKNKINLSYSSLNNYYHCSFKYYLSNILKLNIFEKTFYTIVGNLFHYILSICFVKDIDVEEEYYKYIRNEDYEFDDRELFFLDKLYYELLFIIDVIKEHNSYNSFSNTLYEEEIVIDKSRDNKEIIFKGYVDKIMTDDKNNLAAIIDYKTGSANINLNNIIYGLDMQLPVYIYLVKNKFSDIRIIGFYLQKILHSEIMIDNKHTYEELKKDNLKLVGYTTMYEEDISKFDNGYNDSKVIRGMKTTSKGLFSKKVYDDSLIDDIYKLVDDKIEEAIDNITRGGFDINPKRIGMDNIGCKYCSFKDICFMRENDIVNLKEYKNLDFFKEKSLE